MDNKTANPRAIKVIGHRNPDTDSIVSAMAYAALRNAVGDREYTAARLGHISDETRLILNLFGFEPRFLSRVCTRRCWIWTTMCRLFSMRL